MTWSGCTLLNLKEHLLFLMRIVTSVRGFPGLAGKFSLRFLTLFTKYWFIILAKSAGLLYMDPFSTSFVGDPPDDQPSQLLIFFHTELVSFPKISFFDFLFGYLRQPWCIVSSDLNDLDRSHLIQDLVQLAS